MRAYGVRGAHWEAKIVFFKIKWFFGMTRCHACLRNSVLYPKMRLGRHMYQCWVLAAKPRFRWHAAHFSAWGGSRAWRADSKHKLRACAQFVCVAGEHGWLAEGDKVPNCVGLAPGRRVALAQSTPRAF